MQLKTQTQSAPIEEDYPEVAMNIRVSVKHDEESELLDAAEAAQLRKEVEELRERLNELGEGEAIPFLDYTDERLNEVTVQTEAAVSPVPAVDDAAEPAEATDQPKAETASFKQSEGSLPAEVSGLAVAPDTSSVQRAEEEHAAAGQTV